MSESVPVLLRLRFFATFAHRFVPPLAPSDQGQCDSLEPFRSCRAKFRNPFRASLYSFC